MGNVIKNKIYFLDKSENINIIEEFEKLLEESILHHITTNINEKLTTLRYSFDEEKTQLIKERIKELKESINVHSFHDFGYKYSFEQKTLLIHPKSIYVLLNNDETSFYSEVPIEWCIEDINFCNHDLGFKLFKKHIKENKIKEPEGGFEYDFVELFFDDYKKKNGKDSLDYELININVTDEEDKEDENFIDEDSKNPYRLTYMSLDDTFLLFFNLNRPKIFDFIKYIELEYWTSEKSKYSNYVKNEIPMQEVQPIQSIKSNIKFKGTQTEFIELVKALIENENFEGTQREIIENLSNVFNIEINFPNKLIQDIKKRNNGSETLFLDKLKSSLLNYIESK